MNQFKFLLIFQGVLIDGLILTHFIMGYFEIFYVTFSLEKRTCFNWLDILMQEAVLKVDNNSVTSDFFGRFMVPLLKVIYLTCLTGQYDTWAS